nr:uncharacterized protein LOC107440249 [Parasteatoda tepidariorum]
MSNQEATQPQNSSLSGGSEDNQAGDVTENISSGIQNMNTQDSPIRKLEDLLQNLPVNSVALFEQLDQRLRDDNELREDLELFLFLFFKEAKTVYSFLRRTTSKLIAKEVAVQFTRTDPPTGKKSFEREVPTTYKMIIGNFKYVNTLSQVDNMIIRGWIMISR